jgi:putative membrane protein
MIALPSRGRTVLVLSAALALLALWAGWAPVDRADWLLENALTVLALAALAASYRVLPLSRLSYALVFLFLCLHTVGSHFTYSLVPYDAWLRGLTGRSLDAALGWDRSMYDRSCTPATGSSSPIPCARWCSGWAA